MSQVKRKLVFDDDEHDEDVEEDISQKRRKHNEEESEARQKFNRWAEQFKAKIRQNKVEEDSDIECVDYTDAPSTSSAPPPFTSVPRTSTSVDESLNVYPIKLEELTIRDIIIEVINYLFHLMNYLYSDNLFAICLKLFV